MLELEHIQSAGVCVAEGTKVCKARRISSMLIFRQSGAQNRRKAVHDIMQCFAAVSNGTSVTLITLIFQVPFMMVIYPFSKTAA